MRALVVLPTINESATIVEVIRTVRTASPDTEVLVVDDGSSDGTPDLAEKAGAELGGVHVLRRDRRLGLGSAYKAGFAWALEHQAEAVVQMDSDLSHDPMVVPTLLAGLADHDVVVGSRYVPGGSIPQWTRRRRLLSRFGNRYAVVMLGLSVHDATSGFRAYRADTIRALDLDHFQADGYAFQIELAYRVGQAGGTFGEVPIRFVDRQYGTSKMSGSIVSEAMFLVTRWGLGRRWRRASRRMRGNRGPDNVAVDSPYQSRIVHSPRRPD
jgi:dolichol-phosphate mannosyltransferase